MNDSISTTSPDWPTRWPRGSFKSIWTWVLAGTLALLFVALFVAQQVTGVPQQNLPAAAIDAAVGAQVAIDALLVVVVLSVLPALSRFSLRELGFRAPDKTVVAVAVVGTLAMIVVANGSSILIDYFTHSPHEQSIIQIFQQLHDPGSIALFVVFAVAFVPFAEETVFRVFFFNLGLRFGGFWGGAVLSGVLFGIAHGDVYAALPLALGGIILCAVYYRTRNAFASMMTHSLFNTFSLVLLLVAPNLAK